MKCFGKIPVRMRQVLVLLTAISGNVVFAQQSDPGSLTMEGFEFQIPADPQRKELKKRNAVLENNVVSQVKLGDRFMKRGEYEAACRAYDRALQAIKRSSLVSQGHLDSLMKQIESTYPARWKGKAASYIDTVVDKIYRRIFRARKEWGQSIFAAAKKNYLEALVEKNGEKASEKIRAASDLAMRSVAPYYAGKNFREISPSLLQPKIAQDPAFNDNVQAFLKDCSRMQAAYQFKAASSLEAVDPDYSRRKSEIDFLLRQSRVYYKTKQYDKLRANVEKILVADPYNQEAVRLLSQTYKHLYKIGAARAENDAIAQLAETEWKWVEAVPPDEDEQDLVSRKQSKKKSLLEKKMRSIILPFVVFEDATVESILMSLEKESKTYDPEKKGVTIIRPDTVEKRSRRIPFFTLEHVSLLDVIRYLCDIAGMKYKVDDTAVLVGLENIDDLQFDSFPISHSLVQRIKLESDPEALKGKEEEKDDDETISDGGEAFTDETLSARIKEKESKLPPISSQMLKEYFEKLGITFPEGSTIEHDSRNEKLRVKNTPENLSKIEARLQDLDIPQPLVLIDARLMEINMNAMEELGFDWLLTYTDSESKKNVSFDGFDPEGGDTQTLLSSAKFFRSSSQHYLVNNLKLLPNFGPDNSLDLSLSIRALNQMDRSETIATPRLLVSSGSPGHLNVGEQRFFPEEWSKAEVEIINGTSYSYNAPAPEFGDPQPVGTEFQVTPLVSANNYTIMLTIKTDISRFTGWSSYDYSIIIGAMFNSVANYSVTNLTPKMKMPEFSRRVVQSKVKLFDGETVVIGGILEDIASKSEDKWPLLGDIPLLGRLFTNYSSASVKVNMMLFVTARLMRGNGLPLNKSPRKRGMFEFNDR